MTGARPLRVVQVIDALNVGGAERLVTRLAQAAADEPGVELAVLTLRPSRTQQMTDELGELGVHVGCVAPRTRRHLADPTLIPRLRRRLRRHDVVQCHLGTANIAGVIAARSARRPVVSTLHSIDLGPDEAAPGAMRRRAADLVLQHGPDRVVAIGRAVEEAHAHRVRSRPIEVITNPAPPVQPITEHERRAARHDLGIGADTPVVVAVGRLEPPKGLDVLLSAAELLGARTHVVVAGDGSLRERLAAQIEAAGLDDRVYLLGQVSDVRSTLAAGDVFVSSSRREGMPMAILEAMAAGLPVVATDVGDVRATVGTAGTIVPPGDVDALAAAIQVLLDDRAARRHMGTESLRLASSVHDPSTWFRRWLALWRSLSPLTDGSPPTPRTAP